MNLTGNSIFSLISIFLNVAFGFIYNKLVSVYFGPLGLSLLTHYQNLIAFFMHIPQEGIHKAFINRLTQEEDSGSHTGKIIIHTAIWNVLIFLMQWLGLMAYMYWWDSPLEELFHNSASSLLIGASFFLFTLNLMASSWMIARQELMTYAIYTFILGASSVAGMVACLYFHIPDSLYWIVLAVSLSNFPVFLYMIVKVYGTFSYSWKDIKDLLHGKDYYMPLIIMGGVSLLSGKLLDYVVREIVFDRIGAYETGLWQSAVKISQAFVFLCGGYLSTIFYPNAAELIKDKLLMHVFVKRFMYLYGAATILGMLALFVLRNQLFSILFAEEFLQAKKYFLLILVGDWLRCISWVGTYLLMASADTRRFILFEIVSGIGFMLAFLLGAEMFTWEIMAVANLARYIIYTVLIALYYRTVWMPRRSRS
ncbi:MAG: O-antigen translocase [Cytophagales bacterium]|nr:O-antigen translocase [Cytophaga sp.]